MILGSLPISSSPISDQHVWYIFHVFGDGGVFGSGTGIVNVARHVIGDGGVSGSGEFDLSAVYYVIGDGGILAVGDVADLSVDTAPYRKYPYNFRVGEIVYFIDTSNKQVKYIPTTVLDVCITPSQQLYNTELGLYASYYFTQDPNNAFQSNRIELLRKLRTIGNVVSSPDPQGASSETTYDNVSISTNRVDLLEKLQKIDVSTSSSSVQGGLVLMSTSSSAIDERREEISNKLQRLRG